MATVTYENNPVWAIKSGANTANSGYTKKALQTGVIVCHDNNGELDEFKITSAKCELSETPEANSLKVYNNGSKETEYTVDVDYTVDGKEIDVLRRDVWDVYAEYTYQSSGSSVSKSETMQLNFDPNGDCSGVLLNDSTDTVQGQDVAFAIGGYVKRSRIVGLQPVYESFLPQSIYLMD